MKKGRRLGAWVFCGRDVFSEPMIPAWLGWDEFKLRKADGTASAVIDILHSAFNGKPLRKVVGGSDRPELSLAHDSGVVPRSERIQAGDAGRSRIRHSDAEFLSPAAEQIEILFRAQIVEPCF